MSNKNILKEIDFFLENKMAYSAEERKAIKKILRETLKGLGDSVVNFIDKENNK
ncbi:hypothetical protein C8N46_108118 [Kordia periserrulae]|uniref:Uncharacterized protein n=1 Tax=Kordia periserrulae TaxID=701523 RepID=A0A2T6BUR2_9FLAO|nr:hypothetical protein [Kordia periserrulae]PTX59805.1 hypothetical protein C8N46_108118 [Kordia periserrulae]